MARPLAVDNSKLKEQARRRRLEQARLQQVTEKQPAKTLFGPPIPVSRPNDPTFNKLLDCFGPYETGVYRPFFAPTNDTTTPAAEEGHDRRQTGDNRSNVSGARHGDGRQRDVRHSDNSHGGGDNASRNSRGSSGHGLSAPLAPPSGDNATDASRQGVFEQFVKSASNAPARDAPVPSSDGRHSNKTVRHARPPDPTSGVRPSSTNDRMRNRTTPVDLPRPDRVEESSVVTLTNSSVIGPRSDAPKPGLPPAKSFSTPLQNSSPLLNRSSPTPNNGARRDPAVKNSVLGHGADPNRDYEKTSRVANPPQRVNGYVRSVHVGTAKDALTLNIPPMSGGHEKFDEFIAKLREEVDIPLPLTAIMTPKKMDGSTFPFPGLPEVSLGHYIDDIPNAGLSDDEGDVEDEELRGDGLLLQQLQHPLLSQHPPPPVAPAADVPTNILFSDLILTRDLILSSDSEDEPEDTGMDVRSPPSRPTDMTTTSPGPPDDHRLDPAPDSSGKSRRTSVSSMSSEEESCSSDSESDSSLSGNEGDPTTEKLNDNKDNDDDDDEDKQPKRPSWEISNFIPKSNEQVPFIPGLMSSSSSPLVQSQMSHSDDDADPLRHIICDRVLSPRLSPLPIATSGIDHLGEESYFPGDIAAFLSPSKDRPMCNWGLPQIDITPPAVAAPTIAPGSTPPLAVDFCDGTPCVVVRICRSRLFPDLTNSEIAGTDSVDTGICGTDSASDISCRSATRANCKSAIRAVTPGERVDCSAEPSVSDVRRTPAKRPPEASPGPGGGSQHQIACSPALGPPADARPSADLDPKETRTEKSPRKTGGDRKEETHLSTAKGAKRKAEDGLSRPPDQKRLCERSNSSSSREDRKSQNLTQNGDPDRAKGSRLPEPPTTHPKSPALLITASEDSNSRSSSSQKRNEKSKSQNGYSKMAEKPKRATAATTPCLDGSRNALVTEPSIVSLDKPAKALTTPMVNGVGESPAYPGTFDASEPSDTVVASRKRIAPCEEDDQPLDRRKDPVNGIKKPQRLESSDFYLQQATKLKHEGDSWLDKFPKALSYIESVLAFISHCSALEQEHVEPATIQKRYRETMGLCQYIIRVIENVTNVEKHCLLVISLRIQSVIYLKLYYTHKLEIAKLKTVLDEHNKSYTSKPLQIPSPYQAGHHHSANATTAPGSWNHANGGTPSPHSPRPSPSPAGSIGSVGSAGSSNGESAGGMGKPSSSLLNGHSMTSIVVPQRIHSVMMNYLIHTNHLYQCHESWDQADTILSTHPPVAEFFHSLDTAHGPIDLHSSTLALIRYASEVVGRVRNNAKRLSQTTRAD